MDSPIESKSRLQLIDNERHYHVNITESGKYERDNVVYKRQRFTPLKQWPDKPSYLQKNTNEQLLTNQLVSSLMLLDS